jgi:hypothetical protein
MLGITKAMLRQNNLALAVFVFGAMAIFAPQAQADILFNYPNFSNTAGLTFAGSTTTTTTSDGVVLRVTPATTSQSGAAYYTTGVPLGSNDTFSTTFEFRFTDTGGIDPADGITFVLAQNPTGLGAGGGGLGYQGVPNSVAIEFDTYENGGADSSSNHVAIDTDGVLTDSDLTNLYGVATCDSATHLAAGCMSNGDVWSVTIGYNGSDLSVTAWDTTGEASPFTVYTSLPINIESYLGTSTAYVGFTGGTGAGFENQDILNWEFANTTQLGPTPEPSTLGLVFAGIAGLALVRRRRGSVC